MVNGTLVAETTGAAARMLDDRALLPTQLNEVSTTERSLFTGRRRRISVSTVGIAYEQLGDLLRAGVPILRALNVMAQQASNAAMARVLREVHDDVAGGDTLAEALEQHPEAFPALHASMIRAGEKGGFLEEVLHRLSDFVSRQDTLRSKLIGSLIYPCILMLGGIGAVLVILTFVVPKIRPLLARRDDLPWITKAVFAANYVVMHYYVHMIAALVVVIVAIVWFLRSATGRSFLARAQMRMPLFGPIYTMVALCRFCRIFGTLLANGIPIIQALQTAKDSAGNPILSDAIAEASDAVSHGEPLAGPLARRKLFPPAILEMLAVAEESNTLEKALVEIANTQEARTARQIDLMVRLIEPLMLLLMAFMVVMIAIALLLPILNSSLGGLH